ncbi:MAG: trypsin-like peptidase domain-containing protein [Promethearchaeota archaeon]
MNRSKAIFIILFFSLVCFSGCGFTMPNSSDFSQESNVVYNSFSEDAFPTIKYNVLTGTEEVEYFNTFSFQDQNTIPPFLGMYGEDNGNPDMATIFGTDDRMKITSTSSYPWSAICNLQVTAADDTHWSGSGVMIDAYHVLTCGHLVYIHENGGWASEIEVIPGKKGDSEPYGSASATYTRTYTEWTQYEMPEHDWAVLTLDRTIGDKTGWFGIKTVNYADPSYTGTLHTAGYPSDLDNGDYMYYVSDTGAYTSEYNHWYWLDTAPGQSGSPVWEDVDGNEYVLSIHAYSYEDGITPNMGTRIDQEKFNYINAWLSADTPPADTSDILDPALILAIVIIVAVTIIGIGMLIRSAVKKPSDLKTQREDTIAPYSGWKTTKRAEKLPQKPLYFCPMCGEGIFRDNQRFCINCGYSLLDE